MLVFELFVVFGVVWCTILWYVYRRKASSRTPPIFPGALPIIGHAHVLLRCVIGENELWNYLKGICDYIIKKNEKIICVSIGTNFFYAVADPEDAVSISNSCFDKAFFYHFSDAFLGKGLLISDTAEWKVQRKLLNPAFSMTVTNTYVNEINVQAQRLIKQLTVLAEKGPVAIHEPLINFTTSLLCRTSLGLTPGDQNMIDKEYEKAVDEVSRLYNKRLFSWWLYPSLIYNWSADKRRSDEIVRNVKNMLNPVIKKRRSDLKGNNIKECEDYLASTTGKLKPLLDLLLHLAEEDVLTDDDIRVQINTFLLAGIDTNEVFKNHDDLDKNDLTKLVYLEAVIKEVLRLYPPVPCIGRKLNTDVELQNYTLRAGNTCILSLYNLNRHPSWGPDVMEFKPERWLNPETLPANSNAFAAFAIGKRNCIVKQYAIMTLKTCLAHIVRKFHISGEIHNTEWKFEVVRKPKNPVHVTLTLRS